VCHRPESFVVSRISDMRTQPPFSLPGTFLNTRL